mgnify:CR=1 FL=1
MRVFLDTNVLVSAFATRGMCADVLRVVLAEHTLITREVVLRELSRVLRTRIGMPSRLVGLRFRCRGEGRGFRDRRPGSARRRRSSTPQDRGSARLLATEPQILTSPDAVRRVSESTEHLEPDPAECLLVIVTACESQR